jgi:hypothetical protein
MSTHIGGIETSVELAPEQPGPGVDAREGSTSLDERSRLLQQLTRERVLMRRIRAEGLSDD